MNPTEYAAPGNPSDLDRITISTSNGQLHDWMDYKKVRLLRCFNSLLPETILRSKDTLTELTFSEYALFKNIKRCLKNLHCLRTLTFSDVILDAYHRFLYSKAIDVPTLTNLTITRKTKFTNSEFFLMDFLTRGVNCRSLTKFHLIEEQGVEEGATATASDPPLLENPELLDEVYDNDAVVIARFIMKHHTSLKNLHVLGSQVKVWDSEKTKENFVQNLKHLNLDCFTYHTKDAGLKLILENQMQLKNFKCTIDSNDSERLQNILGCIKGSQETLNYFLIKCKLKSSGLSNENVTSFDCKNFEHCTNLSTFEFTSKLIQEHKDGNANDEDHFPGDTNNEPPFAILNIHCLPTSLRRFVLVHQCFPNDSLEKLFEQLPKFHDLETFKLESKSPFNFQLSWLQALCQMPKIKSVIIDGAFVDVKQEVEELIQVTKRHINISFNNNDISCFPSKR